MDWGIPEARRQSYNSSMNSDLTLPTRSTRTTRTRSRTTTTSCQIGGCKSDLRSGSDNEWMNPIKLKILSAHQSFLAQVRFLVEMAAPKCCLKIPILDFFLDLRLTMTLNRRLGGLSYPVGATWEDRWCNFVFDEGSTCNAPIHNVSTSSTTLTSSIATTM